MTPLPFDYCVSIRQPYAAAILAGVKDIENRVFSPTALVPIGARLGIHVSRSWPLMSEIEAALKLWRVMHVGNPGTVVAPPTMRQLAEQQGHVIGHVRLVHVSRARDFASTSRWAHAGEKIRHWHLADPVKLDEPFVATGRLSVWRVPDGEYHAQTGV